jgi:tRNA A-37 threonylcarbamoyl transferase component Bud32/dipeptidyl aminopeptidase/acylaminoacyl peptidase
VSTISVRLSAALADRYRIERELGHGGMATVYLAEDLKHKRRVAVKVLKPELAAVLGAERFVQEITTTAALQHPHILPLFDSGTADGFLFYVMPFIDGETLRDKLSRETQLGIDEAVRITREVADALDYAHRHGVIHRDIKPENILLHDGRPMVADFGIALAVSAAAGGRMTETGLSLGTPHYMSPEQATAEKELTNRSDIYSLGCVLYEMLTGSPPHVGATAQQIVMKIVMDEARPVTELRKSVPPNVAAAVATAVEKLPADRFATAAKFAEALGNPAYTTTTATAPSAGLAARPYPWTALAAALLVGVGLGGLAARVFLGGSAPPVDSRREQLTFNGLAGRPAMSPNGDFIAFVETACGHARLSLCKSSLVVQEVGSTQARVLLSGATDLQAPRWSHDGLTVVVAGELAEGREGLFAVPRLTGTPQRIGPRGVYDTHPRGDSVMLIPEGATGSALIIALGSGVVVDSASVRFGAASDIAWAPDGRRLVARMGNGLQIFGRDGHPIDSIALGARPVVRWNPAGTAVLFFQSSTVREDRFVQVRVGRDGRILGPAELILGRIPTLYRGGFDVARNTGTLAVETGDANADLWSFDLTARPVQGRRETRGTTWYGYPAVSLDGRSIYYFRGDARGDNIYARDLGTGVEEALTSQQLPGGEAARLSHDGRRLVYGHAGSARVLEYIELPSRQVFTRPAPIWTDLVEPVLSRGFVSTHDGTGEVVVLDSLKGTWRTLAIPDSLNAVNFAASPDGASLAVVAVPNRASESASVYRAGLGGRRLVVGTVPLLGGAFQVLSTFETGEPEIGLRWEDDRTISLARWLDAEDTPSLWRLTIGDGRLTRVAALPVACTPVSVALDGSGRIATCRVDDFRADIWLMTVPGVSR